VHAVKQELLLLLQSECCWQHRDTLAQQSKAAWALLHEIASAGEWTGIMHYTTGASSSQAQSRCPTASSACGGVMYLVLG
jgi:hypothetical protein